MHTVIHKVLLLYAAGWANCSSTGRHRRQSFTYDTGVGYGTGTGFGTIGRGGGGATYGVGGAVPDYQVNQISDYSEYNPFLAPTSTPRPTVYENVFIPSTEYGAGREYGIPPTHYTAARSTFNARPRVTAAPTTTNVPPVTRQSFTNNNFVGYSNPSNLYNFTTSPAAPSNGQPVRRQSAQFCRCSSGIGYNFCSTGSAVYRCPTGTQCSMNTNCCCPQTASYFGYNTPYKTQYIAPPPPAYLGNTLTQPLVGTCPSGRPATGRCFDITNCGSPNYACVNGMCCEKTMSWMSVCGGDEAVSLCSTGGTCGGGFSCQQGYCCECPTGAARGFCSAGGCAAGYSCQTGINKCCPTGGGGGGTGPVLPPLPPISTGNTCQSGTPAVGNCVNGLCPTNFICQQPQNICCS